MMTSDQASRIFAPTAKLRDSINPGNMLLAGQSVDAVGTGQADMKRFPGMRLLPEHFMVIQQAMGLSRQRGKKFWPVCMSLWRR